MDSNRRLPGTVAFEYLVLGACCCSDPDILHSDLLYAWEDHCNDINCRRTCDFFEDKKLVHYGIPDRDRAVDVLQPDGLGIAVFYEVK